MVEHIQSALMRVQQARVDEVMRDELLQLAAGDLKRVLGWLKEKEEAKRFDDAT